MYSENVQFHTKLKLMHILLQILKRCSWRMHLHEDTDLMPVLAMITEKDSTAYSMLASVRSAVDAEIALRIDRQQKYLQPVPSDAPVTPPVGEHLLVLCSSSCVYPRQLCELLQLLKQ